MSRTKCDEDRTTRVLATAQRRRLDEALQCGHDLGIARSDRLAASARTPHFSLGQVFAVEIVLAAIDRGAGKTRDPRNHRKAAPTTGSHLASREQSSPAFVELRANQPHPILTMMDAGRFGP